MSAVKKSRTPGKPAPASGGEKQAGKAPTSGKAEGGFLETRKSLIKRLDNWEDAAGWNEFYRIYSQFLFRVARKAGLTEEEAREAVQETFINVAKNLRKKKFDTEGGSFKAWLMNQTRWRIVDQFRARKPDSSSSRPKGDDFAPDRRTATLERFADPTGDKLERLWDREWKENLTDIALRTVKTKVSPEQYQIFYCYVIKEWPTSKVREQLGVSAAQVYLAKHRVGRLIKREIIKLEKQSV